MHVITLSDFEGEWCLDRRIEDRLTGQPSQIQGHAWFEPVETGMLYREEGDLILPTGARLKALRTYRWEARPGGFAVYFDDGRFFHGADWSDPVARHPCGDDLYRARYDFAAWPRWSAQWIVAGPRKDYTMTTTYRR